MNTQTISRRLQGFATLALCLLLPIGLSGCRQSAAQGEPGTEIRKPEAPPDPQLEPTGPKDPEGDVKIKDPGPSGPPAS
jgi:hypothetical protein